MLCKQNQEGHDQSGIFRGMRWLRRESGMAAPPQRSGPHGLTGSVVMAALLLLAGCGTSTSKTPTVASHLTTASTTPSAAEAEQAALNKRVKATCEHRRTLGSVESIPECERNQKGIDETLERGQKTLEESHAEVEKLKREEASMTPAEKSRKAAEAERAGTAAKELAQQGEREEAEAKRHKREHEYPPGAKHAFLSGCAAEEETPSVCDCWLQKVEARDTLPELEALSLAILHGAPIPRDMKKDLEACKL